MRDANFGGVLESKGVGAGRAAGWLAAIGLIAGVVAACVEQQGSLGADCLKNQDCQSGVCSQLRCVAVSPLLDAGFGPDAADATADGAEPPGDDGSAPGLDATGPSDAPPGADVVGPDGGMVPTDAPADAVEDAPGPDAPADAPVDAPADARLDAAEPG